MTEPMDVAPDDAPGDEPAVMFVRFPPGLIGEIRREMHIVPVPSKRLSKSLEAHL